MPANGLTYPDRFWLKVMPSANGCWEWQGATAKGYGQFRVRGKTWQAHRFSYELNIGPIPTGLHLDHLCRNRRCVNPLHLEPVTNAENQRRGRVARGLLKVAS